MAAKKFLRNVAGRLTEYFGVVISAGAANDGDIPALNAQGQLDITVMPTGIGVNTVSGAASEALAASALVNLYNNAGTLAVRNADATTVGKEAHGFTKAAVASAATATVYTSGNLMTGLTGMTPGARQYLATTAGGRTETAPTASANISMMLGIAASATTMIFEPEEPVTIA